MKVIEEFERFHYFIARMKEYNYVYLLSNNGDRDNGLAESTKDIREAIRFEKVSELEGYLSTLEFPECWEIIKLTVDYKIG